MIEIVNNLILLSQIRGLEPTQIRLDIKSYADFIKELDEVTGFSKFRT